MIEARVAPGRDGVATFAIIPRTDVGLRLAGRGGAVVTGGAGARGSAEAAILVAGLAFDGLMSAGQRKAGSGMIEPGLGTLLTHGADRQAYRQRKHDRSQHDA